MSHDLEARYLAALALAREAGVLARRYFNNLGSVTMGLKGPQDWLTEADGAVEQLLKATLGQAFPEDTFLGEEGGGLLGPRTWVVDPIDGTANFAHGFPHFSISIAYVVEGRTELGLVHHPIADRTYAARRGCGAVCNDRPIRVSDTHDASRATVELGYSRHRPLRDYLAVHGRLVEAGIAVQCIGSAALGLARVAEGGADGYAELFLNSWDALAGLLLVSEAGGWTNDFAANNGLVTGSATLACCPQLSAALIELTGIR